MRLEQVLGNPLSNAVRYTPDGGHIQVFAYCDDDTHTVVVSVRDTGMGIPGDKIDGVFELFAQAHDDFSRREGGLGLGLRLAHSIVQRHDSDITVESDGERLGSRFALRLPASTALAPSYRESATPDAPLTAVPGIRLLVVEDVDDARTPFCEMLRLRGYEVDEAASGEEALVAVEDTLHDAILLDIGLPDIDGYEVAQRIRQTQTMVPMLALTGYGREQDREQAKKGGFDGLLTKRVSLDELEQALLADAGELV